MAWDLGQRPVRQRCSDARVLDPDTAIVALCEPKDYQQLSRAWHDQDTARNLDDALHQLELERAARPPVIEVTVTTPPGGITRTELGQLVGDAVVQFTDAPFPGPRPAGRVLAATRRAREYLLGDLPPVFPPAASPAGSPAGSPLSGTPRPPEDDTPTQEIPVVRADGPEVREVQVP